MFHIRCISARNIFIIIILIIIIIICRCPRKLCPFVLLFTLRLFLTCTVLISIVICVCTLCSFCYWPLGCWLNGLINNNNNNNNSSVWCYGKCDKFASVGDQLHWCYLPNYAQPDRSNGVVPHCACLVVGGRPAYCWHDHGLQESKLRLRFQVCSTVCVCVCVGGGVTGIRTGWSGVRGTAGPTNLRNFQTGCGHLPVLFSGRGVGLTWWQR